jgi:hypothetical protein
MGARTLLVTGVHREELGFGDRVAALLSTDRIDVLRIPKGITQRRTGTDEHFYATTEHREIYLQVRQQVRGRYELLIDLHSGIDEAGPCADVFCRRRPFLGCLAGRIRRAGGMEAIRLIRIAADDESIAPEDDDRIVDASARTWIPRVIWDQASPLYVGLEVYLARAGEGARGDWQFARRVIEAIRSCAAEQARPPA